MYGFPLHKQMNSFSTRQADIFVFLWEVELTRMNDHDFWLSVESFFIDLLHIGWICWTLAPLFPLTWSWVHVLAIANNAVYE